MQQAADYPVRAVERRTSEQARRITALERENADIRRRLTELERDVARMARGPAYEERRHGW